MVSRLATSGPTGGGETTRTNSSHALYREEAEPGEEGRPIFRDPTDDRYTVEWAGAAWEEDGSTQPAKHPAQCWVWGILPHVGCYCASEEPLPPRAVNPRLPRSAGGRADPQNLDNS